MTTPSHGTVEVLGVLVDSALLCLRHVSNKETVHKSVKCLWKTLGERVDKNFMPETTRPSHTQILLGEIRPFTHFKILTGSHGYRLPETRELDNPPNLNFSALTPKSPVGTSTILFGTLSSWSYFGEVSKQNKENVVMGMANLSITNDEGSGKLTSGSNEPEGE
jgi:hypothetical protein